LHASFKRRLASTAAAVSLLLFAGSALARPIWAQVPGINVTKQNLDWENVTSAAHSGPAVAAYAFPLPLGLTNIVHVFYRDKQKCLQHLTATDRGQE
jgi:hypothetical protein